MESKSLWRFGFLLVVTLLGPAQTAPAQAWVQWSGNGHHYLAVSEPAGITWTDARLQAQALGGDLASISSAAENAFVFSLVSNPSFWKTASNPTRVLGPWLGGFQPPGTVGANMNWTWALGEPWGYTNWSPGEPNNWNGLQEDRMQFFALGTAPGSTWNDLVDGSLMLGFVVEATSDPSIAYCTAGSSASGCQASMSAAGVPSATAPTGFLLVGKNVEGTQTGVFFFGANGRQANSWGNGTSYQCVVPPVHRVNVLTGGGSFGACDGAFVRDLNARWCPACPKAHHNPGAGAVVQAQLWYRDPQSTSNQTTSLSDAIEFTVQP